MSNDVLVYLIAGIGALFAIIVIAYIIVSKKAENKNENLSEKNEE